MTLMRFLGKLAWFVLCVTLFPYIVAMVVVARILDRLLGDKHWGTFWQYLWCCMWLSEGRSRG